MGNIQDGIQILVRPCFFSNTKEMNLKVFPSRASQSLKVGKIPMEIVLMYLPNAVSCEKDYLDVTFLEPFYSNLIASSKFKTEKHLQLVSTKFVWNFSLKDVNSSPETCWDPGSAYMEVRVVRTGRTMPMLGFALMEVPNKRGIKSKMDSFF